MLVADAVLMNDHLLWIAVACGLSGSICYLLGMYEILQQRMRRRLGFSFKMIYLSWCALPVSIVTGAIMKLGLIKPAVFGVFLLLAWLFMFLLGVLQRIAPFLATMHLAQNKSGNAPALSELTSETALKICNYGYIIALALLLVGLVLEWGILIRTGSLLGLASGLSLLYFLINIVRIKLSCSAVGQSALQTNVRT